MRGVSVAAVATFAALYIREAYGLRVRELRTSVTRKVESLKGLLDGSEAVKSSTSPIQNFLPLASALLVPVPVHATAQEALQLLDGYQTHTADEVTTVRKKDYRHIVMTIYY